MITGPVGVPSCTVVVCAYTEKRWGLLSRGYLATTAQLADHDQLIMVIDHNDTLENRARTEFDRALVITNAETRGLSGARNTGVGRATGDVVIFLDDDASPEPGWLDAYRRRFADPAIAVVAGAVHAEWSAGAPPRWFPDEFGWVVGCDYRGLPGSGEPVRNAIGANMAIRRSALVAAGAFASEVGRVGTLPVGDEETDLCIRIRRLDPGAIMVRDTAAAVRHVVPADRRRVRYFLSRCYYEGRSKAVLAGRVGSADALSSERSYATRILPTGFAAGLGALVGGDLAGPARSLAIAAGLLTTTVGYASVRRSGSDPAPVLAPTTTPARPVAPVPAAGTDTEILAGGESTIEPAVTAPSDHGWHPLVVSEYDIAGGNAHLRTEAGSRTRLLVTSDGSPLGCVDLPPATPVPGPDEVITKLAEPASGSPFPDEVEPVYRARDDFCPPVSVVIATRGRAGELARCVRSVLASDYPQFELLVVDNNDRPGTLDEPLAAVLGDPRLRILHQPVRGVSPARNLGTVEAAYDIVAATDDDVQVSAQWLREIVAPFVDDDIVCVTGLVVPDGFRSRAQEMFEEFGGFSKGFRPRRYDLAGHRADHLLYPYSPGIYGSGNNLAYRRDRIAALGGYDSDLGPGTPARAGEDLDLFLKVLFDGGTIYYQPRAWVRHYHRDSVDALRRQLRDYGRGLSAVIMTWALSDRRRAAEIARLLPAGMRHLLDPGSGKNAGRSADYPASLRRAELLGLVEGAALTLGRRLSAAGRGSRRGPRPVPLPLDVPLDLPLDHGTAPESPSDRSTTRGGKVPHHAL